MSDQNVAATTSSSAAGGAADDTVLSLDADENPTMAGEESPQTIILISKEGRRLPVARAALMQSELCKTTLEGDKDASEIPLYHIEGSIVQKVIDYLTYHQKVPPRQIEKPLPSSNMRDLVDKWDVEFIEGSANGDVSTNGHSNDLTPPAPSSAHQEFLFKLLLAANYLNIKSLLTLTCAKLASLIKGRTPTQIRTIFNIKNDYTAAEEEEVRKEYKDLIG